MSSADERSRAVNTQEEEAAVASLCTSAYIYIHVWTKRKLCHSSQPPQLQKALPLLWSEALVLDMAKPIPIIHIRPGIPELSSL